MWPAFAQVTVDSLSADPYVSVIIPTYNRAVSLRETLLSLSRQRWSADRFEVVVVDDGSTDSLGLVVHETYPFELRYVRQHNQGSAAARNNGAQHSRGDILVFLDDDMTVDPDYVSALAHEHQRSERTVVLGAFRPWFPLEPTPFQVVTVRAAANMRDDVIREDISFVECTSGNMSVRRSDFFAAGMFQDVAGDPQTLWGDVDFGYRAFRKGLCFRRSHKATLCHHDCAAADLRTSCLRAEIAAQRAVMLFKKHPEIVDMLPMFKDKLPISWRSDPPGLVIRKLSRRVASSNLGLTLLQCITVQLEARLPRPFLLRPLYRWTTGSYIFRGYRQGLRQHGHPV